MILLFDRPSPSRPMNPIIIVGAILGGWVLLLLVSGERSRRVSQIRAELTAMDDERARLKREAEIPIEVS
jgi:hypothetical protein